MFIYKITNQINGKVYIGQTIRPVEARFRRHINDAENNILDTHLARAIRKYGKDNFKIETIDRAEDQNELNNKQAYWIQQYRSTDSNYGYNETDAIYKSGGNTYKSKSEEELDIIRERLSTAKSGGNNPNSKQVKCKNIITQQELHFQTVEECRVYFEEKNHRFITTRVLHEVPSLYKDVWQIAYENDEYAQTDVVRRRGISTTVILEDGTVNTYKSIREMCLKLGLDRASVTKHSSNGEKRFVLDNYIIILN